MTAFYKSEIRSTSASAPAAVPLFILRRHSATGISHLISCGRFPFMIHLPLWNRSALSRACVARASDAPPRAKQCSGESGAAQLEHLGGGAQPPARLSAAATASRLLKRSWTAAALTSGRMKCRTRYIMERTFGRQQRASEFYQRIDRSLGGTVRVLQSLSLRGVALQSHPAVCTHAGQSRLAEIWSDSSIFALAWSPAQQSLPPDYKPMRPNQMTRTYICSATVTSLTQLDFNEYHTRKYR